MIRHRGRVLQRTRLIPIMKSRIHALLACLVATLGSLSALRADAVTDWNAVLEPIRPPQRVLAIMHVAMFDAVNGIERKFEPCHVATDAPPGARAEAAAIQASYNVVSALRPMDQAVFDAQLPTRCGVPFRPSTTPTRD